MPSQKYLQTPRVIIHGGAGNITRENLPLELWTQHQASLLSILQSTNALLHDAADALTAATHAVTLFERNPLYNAGVGAVFTRTGTIELEASVMVSRGKRKRGAAVSLIKHVKHPIKLAAEILKRGDEDDAGGAQGHVHLSGTSAEDLASAWGLELCEESQFWTRKRWEEHRRGLENHTSTRRDSLLDRQGYDELSEVVKKMPNGLPWPDDDQPSWNGRDYLPQGTVGCVVMDRHGTIAVTTSTGGLTNKLPGRIGDTPTFGAGFWAEDAVVGRPLEHKNASPLPFSTIFQNLLDFRRLVPDCFPIAPSPDYHLESRLQSTSHLALGMSGTGNGDSFLRLSAVRTTAAMLQFSHGPPIALSKAVSWMAGPDGLLQRSAGDRWGKAGEGEGGIIGIENANGVSSIAVDFNCGGLFRAWIDDNGHAHCRVFRNEY